MKRVDQVKNGIRLIKEKGFFHIIISSSLVKVISFISAMFLPRVLSKTDYGVLVYVDNIRNYFLMFNALGITNATLRYCVQEESEEEKRGVFLYSLRKGLIIDLILFIGSLIFFLCADFQFQSSRLYLVLMSALPILVFIYEDLQLYLRALFANREYSILSFSYSALMVIAQIVLAITSGILGIIGGRYIAVIISIVVAIVLLKSVEGKNKKFIYPSKDKQKQIFKFGVVMMLTNMSSYVMQLNETFILSWVLNDEEDLAVYKVAAYILTISLFVMQAIITFIFPYYIKHIDDKKWIWKNFKKLSAINFGGMLIIHIILIWCTPFIIWLLYGEKYYDAIPIMRILLVASFGQAVFRMLPGNILAGIGEEKFNLRVNIISMIVHFIIDYVCVSNYGLLGSAVALIIVYYFSGIIMILHLRNVCKKSQI